MSIYARSMGLEQPKLSPHYLVGNIAEYARGQITAQQATDFLGLDATEATQAAEPPGGVESIERCTRGRRQFPERPGR